MEENKYELEGIDMLDGLVTSYYQNKQSLDSYKKLTDKQSDEIKGIMQNANINEYTTLRAVVAKLSVSKRESFDDNKLLAKIKELGFTSIIKTKEYVDMDGLENLIYNKELDATELNDCRIVKEVVSLRVAEKKGA